MPKRTPQIHYHKIKSECTCAREMCAFLKRDGKVDKRKHYINWWSENELLVEETWQEIKQTRQKYE